MRIAPSLLVLLAAMSPTHAAIVDTPQCRADIEEAKRIILKVAARDAVHTQPNLPNAQFCRGLRLDVVDLTAVEALAGRCLTGAQRTREISGLQQSIVITQRQLNSFCRERR